MLNFAVATPSDTDIDIPRFREEEKRLELERRKDALFDREAKPTRKKPRQGMSRN